MQLKLTAIFLITTLTSLASPASVVRVKEATLRCNREVTQKILCTILDSPRRNDVIELTLVQPLIARTLPLDELKDATDIELTTGDLRQMPFGIGRQFHRVEAIWLIRSKLAMVERQNFAGMQQLMALNLYENELKHLPSDAFHDLVKLEFLDLDNNQLSELHDDLLANMPELLVFRASNNRIEVIGAMLFSGNGKIEQIHLNNNDIRMVMADFRLLERVFVVDLEENAGGCSFKAGFYDGDEKGIEAVMADLQWNVEANCRQAQDEEPVMA